MAEIERLTIALPTPMAETVREGHYLVLYENHPDADEGPVEWVEVVSVIDGRRDLRGPF